MQYVRMAIISLLVLGSIAVQGTSAETPASYQKPEAEVYVVGNLIPHPYGPLTVIGDVLTLNGIPVFPLRMQGADHPKIALTAEQRREFTIGDQGFALRRQLKANPAKMSNAAIAESLANFYRAQPEVQGVTDVSDCGFTVIINGHKRGVLLCEDETFPQRAKSASEIRRERAEAEREHLQAIIDGGGIILFDYGTMKTVPGHHDDIEQLRAEIHLAQTTTPDKVQHDWNVALGRHLEKRFALSLADPQPLPSLKEE